ncbi:hypothetical protein EUGRSUZ_H02903 [Eucalyptus grandis]|uniref:Uncharacterized protein n=2 Tax=Eucalyptus grandis TaxID=71139 RepID=A0ACC3JSF0_EUCGR|nr:hypothetical protein EUGRSUZ_H02903 [Eucalyptus grandis]
MAPRRGCRGMRSPWLRRRRRRRRSPRTATNSASNRGQTSNRRLAFRTGGGGEGGGNSLDRESKSQNEWKRLGDVDFLIRAIIE